MIDIVSVGKQKISYKNKDTVKFESLSFYIDLAKKAISRFPFARGETRQEMLKSDDAISSVANSIMMGDWRWDPNREGSSGQKKTHYSYRNQCAIWSIKSYISKKKNTKYKQTDCYVSNNVSDKKSLIFDLLYKENEDPLDLLIEKEEAMNIKKYIKKLLYVNSNILTDRQSKYIKYYFFENLTFSQIGLKYNITREAVRQGIVKILEKIRSID